MPVGSYTAEEMTPPEGYTKSPDQHKVKQTFVWDGKSDVSLIFENDAKVKVRLVKLDDSNNPLPGAVFNIVKDGQIVGTEETKADGSITVTDVTEGMYAFVEVSVPAPYVVSDEPTQTIWLEAGDSKQLIFDNQKQPLLKITKIEKGTNQPILGTVFLLEAIDGDYRHEVTTEASGSTELRVAPGSYRITEQSVPEPYCISDEPTQTISLNGGDEKEVIFQNLKKPQIIL